MLTATMVGKEDLRSQLTDGAEPPRAGTAALPWRSRARKGALVGRAGNPLHPVTRQPSRAISKLT